MKNLPNLTISKQLYLEQIAQTGNLVNRYNPFQNLLVDGKLQSFQTANLELDLNSPVNIEVQPSFDGSVNLILNNDSMNPRLINSKFSVQEGNTFAVIDQNGNKDTNIYDDTQLDLDTRLYKTINKIPTLEFEGLSLNGKMKCGSYNFYFKFSDNDGNETDFISESGVVVCHIGNINDPQSIRMGMSDEDSKKSIKFKLSNLDTAYDYIRVYYTRTTSDSTQQKVVTAHYIDDKFQIDNDYCELLITGFENHVDIDATQINPLYEIADSVKAQAQCQDMLFFGNINKPTIPYQDLADLSLHFIPNIISSDPIGNLDGNYRDQSGQKLYEYYNANNIYSNLGYWPEEYYRFGIIYLLNDFTLSPVFNIRGLDLDSGLIYQNYPIYKTVDSVQFRNYIGIDENNYLINKVNAYENSDGVIKLGKQQVIYNNGVRPLAIQFNVQDVRYLSDGVTIDTTYITPGADTLAELAKYTKGFFIVRQERVPTIYAQGVAISKTNDGFGNLPLLKSDNNWIIESFLSGEGSTRILGDTMLTLATSTNISQKAALIPEAELKYSIFNQLFTSTNYLLTSAYEQSADSSGVSSGQFINYGYNNYYLNRNSTSVNQDINTQSLLTLVMAGLKLTTNGTDYFSSKAGDETEAWQTEDVIYPWNWTNQTSPTGDQKINQDLTLSNSLIRGAFGTYIGLSNGSLPFGTIFNVRDNDYSTSDAYKLDMFKLRMDSSEPYSAVSDRISWNNFSNSLQVFRGDCYVCNFSHRMHYNFIDPDLPSNDNIIDINTWNKNYAVYQDASILPGTPGDDTLRSLATNRCLITYKEKNSDATSIIEPTAASYATAGTSILTGLGALFGGSDTPYTVRGCDKINRADVNAVPLGHWATFKVMSNINLSMRDIDFDHSDEEALIGHKRSFYPLQSTSNQGTFKLPDSNNINGGNNVTLSQKKYFVVPDVPFIKNNFDTRIIYSDTHITDAFRNGYRVFEGGHYQDYTKIYGSIVDLKEWMGNLFCTMEHGCLLIPVNERAIAAEGKGGLAYINTSNVLPQNPRVISDLFGTTWQESVVKTKTGLYGIDTVAKKIWHSDGQKLDTISDLKVQKFLNDNITLKESDKLPTMGLRNVKSHYNKYKGDIMFTFYDGTTQWNLCYNENLKKFITYYSWIPSHSANIDNIFFSFDVNASKSSLDLDSNGKIIYQTDGTMTVPTSGVLPINFWKHGEAGIYDYAGVIQPTNWYGNLQPFEFEFIVADLPIVQKIFNNLKIISNKAEPSSFEFEIVGESYDWREYKDIIVWISNNAQQINSDLHLPSTDNYIQDAYIYVLSNNLSTISTSYPSFPSLPWKQGSYIIPKLPYLPRYRSTYSISTGLDAIVVDQNNYELNTSNTTLLVNSQLTEDRIHTEQLGNNIKKCGRVRGNMEYLEDEWDVEIKPFNFKYAYISNGVLAFTNAKEARLRDKYLKIRVKYSGKDLAIIQAIKTFFTISYA